MKFYVTKDVFEKIPDGKFGLVSVIGADNTGINPNRYMCAIEALMTRIAKGQGMPAINTIVDLETWK